MTQEGASAGAEAARTEPPPERPAGGGRGTRLLAVVRRHWLFLALFAAGVSLRIVASIAYHPALIRADSVGYLRNSQALEPSGFHPIGYPAFLRMLPVDETLAAVSATHHALVLGLVVALYLVLNRLGVPAWLAALATAPVLLDAYQLNIERHVLSESLFMALVAGACVVLLWRGPPGLAAAALAGALLAAAGLTRTVALAVVVPAVVAALLVSALLPLRRRLARAGLLVGVVAVTLAGYAVWFQSHHGVFGVTTFGGRFLYGRVVEIADCRGLTVPAHERPLCPEARNGERPNANQLLWSRSPEISPFLRLEPPPGKTENEVAGDFAKRVIRERPLAYARVVAEDFLQSFAPTKVTYYDDVPVERWHFPEEYRQPPPGHRWAGAEPAALREYPIAPADTGAAAFLRAYGRAAYTPGTLLGICLIVGLLAALGIGRAKRSGLRTAAFTFAAAGLALVLASVVTTIFNWRYHLPQLVLLPPAAAVGLTALLGLRADRETEGSAGDA